MSEERELYNNCIEPEDLNKVIFMPKTRLGMYEDTTLYNPIKGLPNDGKSLVLQTEVTTTAERILQLTMSGQMLQANRLGYDIRSDKEIPEKIRTAPPPSSDVTTMMAWVEAVGERMHKIKTDINANIEMRKQQAAAKAMQQQQQTTTNSPSESSGVTG